MRNYKNTFFYVIVTSLFSGLIYWVLKQGKTLEKPVSTSLSPVSTSSWDDFTVSMSNNLQEPLSILLIQIVAIVIIARIFGFIFKKIGQPSVIGEIIAGIALGPSLLGLYFPEFSASLFPVESLGNLKFLSQIGLILFMFVIGMELDVKVLKNKANDAVVISHASIIIPFALGISLAYFIFDDFAPDGVKFLSFSLFLGISMSITAFPVLARIVQERGMHKSRLGAIVITCAAADDITAWCLLAVVIAIVKAGNFESALYVILSAVFYLLIMLLLIKPFLERISDLSKSKENLGKSIVAIFFIILIISSYTTEIIGIHALFGAFIMGVIMPNNTKFRNLFIDKVEDVSVILLLPLFFVFTGLKTEIGLLKDPYLWEITGLIVLVAIVGKFFGSSIAAKFVGQSWRDSLIIGALMNTRGLMELIVLNIGLELNVLSPEIFTMMVVMALVTTFTTGPALNFINYVFKTNKQEPTKELNPNKYHILISSENPQRSITLLRLANCLVKNQKNASYITAMHFSQSEEINPHNLADIEKVSFSQINIEAKTLGQEINTVFKATVDPETDISETISQTDYDLLLLGMEESIFQGTILGNLIGFTTRIISPLNLIDTFTGKENIFENSPFDETTRQIISKTKKPVGILLDKDLHEINKVTILLLNPEDSFLLEYAKKLIYNNNSKITVKNLGNSNGNFIIESLVESLSQEYPTKFSANEDIVLDKSFFSKQNLTIVSLETWKILVNEKSEWLQDLPSVLIFRQQSV